MRTLSELKEGEEALIVKVKGKESFRKRLIDMGFVPGSKVKVIHKAPMRDPVIYSVLGCNISLRKHETEHIEVDESTNFTEVNKDLNIAESVCGQYGYQKKRSGTINVALVGNFNSGKTTLFNKLTGFNEKTGNYPGTTQQAKEGVFKFRDYTINIVDLPGVNSFSDCDSNELYVRNYLIDNLPDVIIDLVNMNYPERNFYLTLQLVDMHYKCVAALNFYDEFQKSGCEFDYGNFGKMIGVPMVAISADKRMGFENMLERVIDVYEDRDPDLRHVHIQFDPVIESSIENIRNVLQDDVNYEYTDHISNRYMAIKLLENDSFEMQRIKPYGNYKKIMNVVVKEQHKVMSLNNGELVSDIFATGRFAFLRGALKETLICKKTITENVTDRVDNVILNKYIGIPLFFIFMWLMFQATFTLGGYPSDAIAWLIDYISKVSMVYLPQGWLKDLFVNGILSGAGGVIVFLPNILILFLFISLLEDTGYMSRVVFMMDKMMHKIGLHGKSLVPMIMGFGCNVPAILASRMIEDKKDRLITILINPFMSCSGRFPLYVLFIGAFFAGHSGLVLLTVYSIGILVAIITSVFLRKTVIKPDDTDFVMELPPYRLPNGKAVLYSMWHNSKAYLQKIMGVVLVGSIIIWALGYFPYEKNLWQDYYLKVENVRQNYDFDIDIAISNGQRVKSLQLVSERDSIVGVLNADRLQGQLSNSYIADIGRFVEPVLKPLGFDWKMTVAIISGIPAKEITVGTMGVLYHANSINSDFEDEGNGLSNILKNQVYITGPEKGQPVFDKAVALSFMVFILLYVPCLATVSAIAKESKWQWALFSVFYSLAVAWVTSFIVYNVAGWFV